MFEYDLENEDKELKQVGLELMFLTPEKYSNPEGITAVELSKRVGINVETVKKKLKILYAHEIIRCSGMNPKYWRFDEYNYQRLQKEADRAELISSQKTWVIWLCIAIIFSLTLLVVIGYLLHRSYQRKVQIRNEYLLSRLTSLESEMSVKKISITEEELQTSSIVTKFREYATNISVKPTFDDWSELRIKMDNAFPRLMSILTDSRYDLQQAEIEISMLIRLRFSTTQIAFLTGYTNSGVGNIRRKLLRVIFKEDGGAKDFNYKIIHLN